MSQPKFWFVQTQSINTHKRFSYQKLMPARNQTGYRNYLRNLCPFLVKLLLLGLDPLCLSQKSHPPCSLGIWIQLQHCIQVLERVLLHWCPLHLLLDWPHHRLNLVRVDDPSQISIYHLCAWQEVSLLLLRCLIKGSIDWIHLLNCRFGPDNEPSKMATGSEFQKIEPLDVSNLNPRNVSESLYKLRTLRVVDDQQTFPWNVAAVPHLTLFGTNTVAVFRLLYIRISANLLQLPPTFSRHSRPNLQSPEEAPGRIQSCAHEPSRVRGRLRRRWRKPLRTASGWRWSCGASGARSWWGRTSYRHGTCFRRHPGQRGGGGGGEL